MELLPFQVKASNQIASRFSEYMTNPLTVTRTRIVPFYQNLSSITGSGKTLILSDAVEQIRSILPVEPIVLWLSKGKVVVWQTYTNLASGKYSNILGDFNVKPLLDCKQNDIIQTDNSLALIATVGKFNQKDKDQGDRKIFKVQLDNLDRSLWELLKTRQNNDGIRRPFIIVYDEGHNLSDQQTDLLLELEPDALIAASATIKIPESLGKIIDRLRDDKNWSDNDFVTSVKSSEVVSSGLVKQNIMLSGYVTPMENTIDDMIEEMEKVSKIARENSLPFPPKAIYVTNTNIVSGVEKDNIKQPFHDRLARPIIIWRYLVEEKRINPNEIAVYCNLKFDKKYQPPENFNLFSSGDSDYDDFIAGDYKHIIFNQTLQEGWDDPSCYFAYIDKDMGSKIQVEQIIGRALRQPGAKHYSAQELNTAQFFIRTDEKSVFEEVVQKVRAKISAESPEINLHYFKNGLNKDKPLLPPKNDFYVPEVSIYSESAKKPIKEIIDKIQDSREDKVNTVGKGGRIQVLQTIGSENNYSEEWVDVEHNNRVSARWVFVREIQKYYGKAVNLCDIEDVKFDALVEYNSRAAAHLRDAAQKVVKEYLAHSVVVQNDHNLIGVTSLPTNLTEITRFNNSIHEGYSGLNGFEKKFAQTLDNDKYAWMRNPSRGFFEVPLLNLGSSKNFNPDFIVWKNDSIIVIDTKGDHLIVEDSSKKLFHVKQLGEGPNLKVRLITEGEWDESISRTGKNGFTVWVLKNGKVNPIWCKNIEETVGLCLDNIYD